MSKTDDGGQAFPVTETEWHRMGEGMSIRDWFAGQAIMGILAFPRRDINNLTACQQSYQIADAMIAERNKQR